MLALQHYYTSAQRGCGLSKINGFQTVAMSTGIKNEEIKVIEELGTYPSIYCLEEFPIKLAFYKLPTGRFAISRSIYIGKDYSGREGNFFTHTLVLEELPEDFQPALTFYLKIWKEEFDCSSNGYLPPIEIDIEELRKLRKEKLFELRQFLCSNMKTGMALVNAICEKYTGRRIAPISVFDTPQNVIYWILLLCEAFPTRVLSSISFSSFDKNDYFSRPFDLVGDPLAGETEPFNLYSQTEKGGYGEIVVKTLVKNPEHLKGFLRELNRLIKTPDDFKVVCKLFKKKELIKISVEELTPRFYPVVKARIKALTQEEIEKLVKHNFKGTSKEKIGKKFLTLLKVVPYEDKVLDITLQHFEKTDEKINFLVENRGSIKNIPDVAPVINRHLPLNYNWFKNQELSREFYSLLEELGAEIPEDLRVLNAVDRIKFLKTDELLSLGEKVLNRKNFPKELRKGVVEEIISRVPLEEKGLFKVAGLFRKEEIVLLLKKHLPVKVLPLILENLTEKELKRWLAFVPLEGILKFCLVSRNKEIIQRLVKSLPPVKRAVMEIGLLMAKFAKPHLENQACFKEREEKSEKGGKDE